MPAAAMLVHQLRYLLAYGGGADQALTEQGHAYLSSVTPWVVFLFAAALGAFLGRLARAWRLGEAEYHSAASPLVVWLAAAAGLVVLYAGQELLEGLFAIGHPPEMIGVFGDGGWWALPGITFRRRTADACAPRGAGRDPFRCGPQGQGPGPRPPHTVRKAARRRASSWRRCSRWPRLRRAVLRHFLSRADQGAGAQPGSLARSTPRKERTCHALRGGCCWRSSRSASLPAIAGAHPGNPDFRSVIQGFSPQIPGSERPGTQLGQQHAAFGSGPPHGRDLRLRPRSVRAAPARRNRPG